MAALSGILLALAFPPFNLFLLSLVALAPLFLCLRGANFWQGFSRGFVFGFVLFSTTMFWLMQFVTRWTGSAMLGAVPWLIAVAYLSIFFGLFGATAATCWRGNKPWLIPFVWAGFEVIRSTVPSMGFSWAVLGGSLWKMPALMQPAWWGGVYFLSTIVCFCSVAAVMAILKKPVRVTRAYVGAFLLPMFFSALSFSVELKTDERVVAAVQPGTDMAFAQPAVQNAELANKVPEAMSVGFARLRDITLLPEGIARWDEGDSAPSAPFDMHFVYTTLLGGQRIFGGKTYQSVFGIDGYNKWLYSDKSRLVPFGEYVPFRDRLPFLKAFNLPTGDITAAEAPQVIWINVTKVGPLICFEALFEDVARSLAHKGAEMFVVPSNDDWYQNTAAPEFLKAASITRAIENRMPVVRATPLGPSCIIDEKGQVVAESKIGQTTTIFATVRLGDGFVSPLRDIFPLLVNLLALAVLFLPQLFAPRTKSQSLEADDQLPAS